MKKLFTVATVAIALATFAKTNHWTIIVHKAPNGTLTKSLVLAKAITVSVTNGSTNSIPHAVYDVTVVNGKPVATNLVSSTIPEIRQ